MDQATLFSLSFEEKPVRVLQQGTIFHWILADVCAILRINEGQLTVSRMDGGSTTIPLTATHLHTTIINDSDLWSLAAISSEPEAKRFRTWLKMTAFPILHQVDTLKTTPQKETSEAVHDVLIKAATVKADGISFEETTTLPEAYNLRDSAKQCGWPERRFIQRLLELKWLYTHPATGRKCAYADKIKAGYMTVRSVPIRQKAAPARLVAQSLITQKGLVQLKEILGPVPVGLITSKTPK